MLIDFHVHMFPEAIAKKTFAMLLKNMSETYNIEQSLSYGGTLPELLEDMEKTNVDISVIQHIATKPHQHKSINEFALSVRSDKVISFGSLHPYGDNLDYELCDLKEKGFVGIKLHPDYQGVNADDEKFIDIEQYSRIIENHGTDKILFGSDAPWESPKDTYEFLIKSGIAGDDLDKITHRNAEEILRIKK